MRRRTPKANATHNAAGAGSDGGSVAMELAPLGTSRDHRLFWMDARRGRYQITVVAV